MVTPATSGNYAFSPSADRLIKGSLRLCSAINEEETPGASMALTTLEALNGMVKGWQGSGIHVWSEEKCILFTQAGQSRYQFGAGSPDQACLFENFTQTALSGVALAGAGTITLASVSGLGSGDAIGVQLDAGTNFWTTISGAPVGLVVTLAQALPTQASSGALVFSYDVPLMRPLRVPAGRRMLYSSGIQTPMIVMSRLDYDFMPNPSNTGVFTQFFYDPKTGNQSYITPMGIVNLWPTPGDYTNAFRFVAQRPIQDFTNLSNLPDFPAEWYAALRWNLAVEIAPEYDVPAERFDRLKLQADKWFTMASQWDREPESYLFGVARQPAYRT